MQFSDYKDDNKKLIGLPVLLSVRNMLSLKTIEKITKTSFSVFGMTDKFSITNGYLKGRSDWDTTHCTLITEEEATGYRKEWTEKRLIKESLVKIKDKLDSLDLKTLQEIVKLIN